MSCLIDTVVINMMMMMMMIVCVAAEDMQGKTEEEIEMMKLMGFGSFDTTKVRGNRALCKS